MPCRWLDRPNVAAGIAANMLPCILTAKACLEIGDQEAE
jgi:hypothetical protein